jgi:altronate hydrolase
MHQLRRTASLMDNNALKVNASDNVAIAIKSIRKGDTIVIEGEKLFLAVQDIEPSHKIALKEIDTGATVIRYGEPIVQAKQAIHIGEWVHIHNTQPIPKTQL